MIMDVKPQAGRSVRFDEPGIKCGPVWRALPLADFAIIFVIFAFEG
jgi:hypothetical protein